MDLEAIGVALDRVKNNPDARCVSDGAKALLSILMVHPNYIFDDGERAALDELFRAGLVKMKLVVVGS